MDVPLEDEAPPLYQSRPPSIAPSLAPSYRTLDPNHTSVGSRKSSKLRSNLDAIFEDNAVPPGRLTPKKVASDEFLSAILANDARTVEGLLKSKKADPNRELWALAEIKPFKARFMKGLKLEGRGEKPLYLAWNAKLWDVVKILIENGADPNICNLNGLPLLSHALQLPDFTIAKSLVEAGANVHIPVECYISILLWVDLSALMFALRARQPELVEALLTHGANPQVQDPDGRPALSFAVMLGYLDSARSLLLHHANVDAQEVKEGLSASDTSEPSTGENLDLQKENRNDGARNLGWTALMHAAFNDDDATMELLLQWMASVDIQTSRGETALMITARHGNTATARLLLGRNADVNLRNSEGETALILAMDRSHVAMVKLLVEHNAYVNVETHNNMTPLMLGPTWACSGSFAKLLIEHGADVDVKDPQGRTALMFAAKHSASDYVGRLLMEGRAQVNAQDLEGRTALMYAADSGNPSVVQLLLEEGADVKQRDNDDKTALHYAARRSKSFGRATIILSKGETDIDAKDRDGRTPLMEAIVAEEWTLVEILLQHGASLATMDNEGNTPLGLAAVDWTRSKQPKKNEDILRALIDRHPSYDRTEFGDTHTKLKRLITKTSDSEWKLTADLANETKTSQDDEWFEGQEWFERLEQFAVAPRGI